MEKHHAETPVDDKFGFKDYLKPLNTLNIHNILRTRLLRSSKSEFLIEDINSLNLIKVLADARNDLYLKSLYNLKLILEKRNDFGLLIDEQNLPFLVPTCSKEIPTDIFNLQSLLKSKRPLLNLSDLESFSDLCEIRSTSPLLSYTNLKKTWRNVSLKNNMWSSAQCGAVLPFSTNLSIIYHDSGMYDFIRFSRWLYNSNTLHNVDLLSLRGRPSFEFTLNNINNSTLNTPSFYPTEWFFFRTNQLSLIFYANRTVNFNMKAPMIGIKYTNKIINESSLINFAQLISLPTSTRNAIIATARRPAFNDTIKFFDKTSLILFKEISSETTSLKTSLAINEIDQQLSITNKRSKFL
jgi:hypothetical protein